MIACEGEFLGCIIRFSSSFLVGLGFSGINKVAVEFEHGFYILLVTSGGV